MDAVRLGVIGCGVIGPSHLKLAAACETAEVIAVADLIPERLRAVGDRFGVQRRYPDDETLLADDDVEAVVLAMPVGDRTPVAFKALAAGKHVLLEKPVAGSAADVARMMAMQGDRVVACCSPRMVFTGPAQAAADCVASGALGEIRVVRFRAIQGAPANPNPNPPPWRESMAQNGGGILVNWSCYDLDYMMSICGWQLEPVSVMAQWWPVAEGMAAYADPESDADAHYLALIQCLGGAVLSMERAEFSSCRTDQAWEIIGTDGTLHAPMRPTRGEPNVVVLDRFVPGEGVVSEALWEQGDPEPDWDVIRDFARAVRAGAAPQTPLCRALTMQKISDAVYASGTAGGTIML